MTDEAKPAQVSVPWELYSALVSLYHTVDMVRGEQVSDKIFGGQQTDRQKANSQIYASRILEDASKIDNILGEIGRHFGHDT